MELTHRKQVYLAKKWSEEETNLPGEIRNLEAIGISLCTMLDSLQTQLSKSEERAKKKLKDNRKESKELASLKAFKNYRVS